MLTALSLQQRIHAIALQNQGPKPNGPGLTLPGESLGFSSRVFVGIGVDQVKRRKGHRVPTGVVSLPQLDRLVGYLKQTWPGTLAAILPTGTPRRKHITVSHPSDPTSEAAASSHVSDWLRSQSIRPVVTEKL